MMNQDNPYAMNQTCKVCGEPAAGFHFGAFTCEGCKSFFGRSYNNLSSISDCKNNGECIINKKNRTACKACRLRKCLLVGMSKSGSRYGRRSNWFKIHCLLQEQQQQAAAVMAAHHNNQQQAAQQHHGQHHGGQKSHGIPPPAAAAAALGMLGHPGAYPGLYPPRTKEELMMLGLEEYAAAAASKHHAAATASPSVSSPDSHNSDSSVEVRHLSGVGNHSATADCNSTATAPTPSQLRKDLPPFLPLHFAASAAAAGLSGMPVMPPPAFLPPSHLLFPGYHPALYQHHQGLLKPSPEQQQQAVAAAAAVQHLFNATTNATPSRYTPTMPAHSAVAPLTKLHHEHHESSSKGDTSLLLNNNNNSSNHNHVPNGIGTASEELTKRFYLDAVLKSQRNSPPPAATKLPAHTKHDHSISALVTPNSESGRDQRLKSSRQHENEDDEDEEIEAVHSTDGRDSDSECGEDLVVSMTPPRSPANLPLRPAETVAATTASMVDNPIDLSMKTGSSEASTLSSKCSSTAADSENENEAGTGVGDKKLLPAEAEDENNEIAVDVDEELNKEVGSAKTAPQGNDGHNNNNNNNNNNNTSFKRSYSDDSEEAMTPLAGVKRKLDIALATKAEVEVEVKRAKLQMESMEKTLLKVTTTTPLDLTTKV